MDPFSLEIHVSLFWESFFIHLISIGYLPHAKHSCWEHINQGKRTSCAHEKDSMKNRILMSANDECHGGNNQGTELERVGRCHNFIWSSQGRLHQEGNI